jgi:hypothetical protein
VSAVSATLQGRLAAEALMVDTAVVSRPGGAAVLNATTGILTPAAATTVHTGPCRMRQPTAFEAEVQFGEEQVTTSRFIACFPNDVTGLAIDDVVMITVSDDADMLNRRFRVLAISLGTYVLYKGYPVESVE